MHTNSLSRVRDVQGTSWDARNLKGHAVYGKIGLAKDMTPSERETEHKLREELFRRKDAGEDVRISNGRIVVANRRGSRP